MGGLFSLFQSQGLTNVNPKEIILQDWWHSKNVADLVTLYCKDHTGLPDTSDVKQNAKSLLLDLQNHLQMSNFCGYLEYTGSTYEGVNITGVPKGLDVMFVNTKSDANLEQIRAGFFRMEIDNEELDSTNYHTKFFGQVRRFLNQYEMEIIERDHGVAVQIDVTYIRDEYQIDLVPTVRIDNHLYVPKDKYWRKSFSIEEKELIRRLDLANGCRKHCIRLTKSFFKKHVKSQFSSFTSYYIKTVAFWLKDDTTVSWQLKDLGECFIFFLAFIKESLQKRVLRHYFIREINLLDQIHEQKITQMADFLEKMLSSELKFSKRFSNY